MNEQNNVEVVQSVYAAFGRGDVEAILAMLTADIDWQLLGSEELPTAGRRRGPGEVAKFFEQVGQTWSFERFEPRQFIAQGDTVVVLGFYSGTAKTSGKPFATEWAQVFTITDGKVSKFREYADMHNLIGAYSGATARV
jgi:ketosteroid isomerase-like protein